MVSNVEHLSSRRVAKHLLAVGVAVTLVSELAIVLCTETSKTWRFPHPYGLVVATGMWGAFFAALWFLTNRRGVALLITAGLSALLAFVHIRKLQILDQPLVPWDLAQTRQVIGLLPAFRRDAGLLALGAGLVGLIGGLIVASRRPGKLAPRQRALGLALASIALWGSLRVFSDEPLRTKLESALSVRRPLIWPREDARQVGLLLTLASSLNMVVKEPKGYSEMAARAALGAAPLPNPAQKIASLAERPDVLVVLGESVSDPQQLGFRLDGDALPFLHSLEARFPHGRMSSPVFGGWTANAEFEVITGIPIAFLPKGSLPYLHFISKPLPSLPRRFREAGWSTSAVHPFHDWFFSRNRVYPLLGIEAFDALDTFAGASMRAAFVADEAFVDGILRRIPDTSERSPAFVLGISMATHCFYDYRPVPGDKLAALGLRPGASLNVTNYANGVAAFDAAMRRLFAVLAARSRPTIVAVFGDHQPFLGDDYQAYRQAGILEGEVGQRELVRFAQVPAWIWWNDAAAPTARASFSDLHLAGSLATLGSRVARAAGLAPTSLDAFTLEAAKQLPVLRQDVVQSADQRIWAGPADVDDPALRALIERWELVAYDALFGTRGGLDDGHAKAQL